MVRVDQQKLREYLNKSSYNERIHGYIHPNLYQLSERIIRFSLYSLKEAYRLNFDWIRELVDDLYRSDINFDDIYNKYKVVFKYNDGNVLDDGNPIVQAAYDRKRDIFYIWPGKNLDDLIEKPQYKQRLYNEFEKFLGHEYIHKQQNQLKSSEQDLDPDYLAGSQEIAAFAYSIANEAYKKNKMTQPKDIIDLLINDPNKLRLSGTALFYLDEYKKTDPNIYKEFLSKIYDYFQDFFEDDPLEYKNVLKLSQS